MAVRSDKRKWVRLTDGDLHVVAEQPCLRCYPAKLEEIIETVQLALNPPLGGVLQARAIGSHWAMSHAGVTNGFMIETATPVHEPESNQGATRLNHALYDVIPDCLTPEALRFFRNQNVPTFNPAVKPTHQEIYLLHVEAGMRIHELYAYIDDGDMGKFAQGQGGSLADLMKQEGTPAADYSGPWAVETMGTAGGQTIAGAFSTGTHGGDILFGPLADSVIAVHLVDAQGHQHWIERTRLRPSMLQLRLIDEDKLTARFPGIQYYRDDDLMNAVTVACGRMGAIYSVVLRVVRQYALEQHWKKEAWSDVKKWINGGPIFLFNRFLRIDVNPYGTFTDPMHYDCYVNTRLLRELNAAGSPDPMGRNERGKTNAGQGPPLGLTGGFFDNPCASDNYIRTALNEYRAVLAGLRDKAIKIWLACAAVMIFPLTPPYLKNLAFAAQQKASVVIAVTTHQIALVDFLFAHVIPDTVLFGDTVAALANYLAHQGLFALLRAIYENVAEGRHEDLAPMGISYAIMDEHDYLNVGCVAPGDSIEIFLDATSPKLIDFIDLVLARVRQLEAGNLENGSPAAFGGYISLRFMAQSEAHLGMQRWPRTCSIEIAGLSRVEGTGPLLKQVEEDAVKFGATLHWGQRNNWSMRNVEDAYNPFGPTGSLFKWRDALSLLTDHGRHAVFSTDYSKRVGLEITDPIIDSFTASPTEGCPQELTTLTWDAIRNPPETKAFLLVRPQQGAETLIPLPGLADSYSVPLGTGRSTLSLVLQRPLNANVYEANSDISVRGFANNDEWEFVFTAEPRLVDGVIRWTAECNLFSQSISNKLRVAKIRSTFAGIPSWLVRSPDIADVRFTTAQSTQSIASLPVFNKRWLFFSEVASGPGPGPVLKVAFKLVCPP
jgi:hypothetical protein